MTGVHALRSALRTESWEAAADLSAKQFYLVKQDSTGKAALITATTDKVIGVLDNTPSASGRLARVIDHGIAKVVSDGSGTAIVRGDYVEPDSTGRVVQSESNRRIGIAMTPSSAAGSQISVLLFLAGAFIPNDHIKIESVSGKQIRLNNRVDTSTSGSILGFQSKVDCEGAGTAEVKGAEIDPRVSNSGACSTLVGLSLPPEFKSDAGNCSGDMRGIHIQLLANPSYTGTISDDVIGVKIRMDMYGTISGDIAAIELQAAGGGKGWDYLLKLPDVGANAVFNDDTAIPTSNGGQIKVKIGSSDRYIALYTTSN